MSAVVLAILTASSCEHVPKSHLTTVAPSGPAALGEVRNGWFQLEEAYLDIAISSHALVLFSSRYTQRMILPFLLALFHICFYSRLWQHNLSLMKWGSREEEGLQKIGVKHIMISFDCRVLTS